MCMFVGFYICVCGIPLSQFVHHFCQECSVGSGWVANAYSPDQSRPKRVMGMMKESNLSWNIHHVQCGPDDCQTSRAWEVEGCQERSLPGELNKCFMNFKRLAVCPPAVLKRPKVWENNGVLADRRNLHIFAFILQHVNLPALRSAFTVSVSLVLLSPRCLFILGQNCLSSKSFS